MAIIDNFKTSTVLGGSSGTDVISNYAGGVTILAGAGDDYIESSVEENFTVNGDWGQVTIDAGAGNDTILNYDPYVSINGGFGNDVILTNYVATVLGGTGDDVIINRGTLSEIDGGDGDDYLMDTGTMSAFQGGGGNDTIEIDGGVLTMIFYDAGDGNDVIVGYNSTSMLILSDDSIYTTVKSGDDVIIKVGSGSITVKDISISELDISGGSYGGNTQSGGDSTVAGISLKSAASNTVISGTDNADTIESSGTNVTVNGGSGNDSLYATGANIVVNGGGGNDMLANSASAWNVTLNAGAGDDTVASTGSRTTIDAGDGNDSILNSGSSVLADGGDGDDFIYAVGISNDNESSASNLTLRGGKGADRIVNHGINVLIDGGDDDDVINNDTVASNVTIDTGAGNDAVINYGSNVRISLGSGNDTALSEGSYSTVNGGAGDDMLVGNKDYEVFDGGDGADSIVTEGSHALINGGNGNDSIDNQGGELSTINGGTGNDSIDNRGSEVMMNGDDGNDFLINRGSKTTVRAGAGNDGIGNSGDSVLVDGGDGIDLIMSTSDASNVTINGGAGDDEITNSSEFSFVEGGEDNDSIINSLEGANSTLSGGNGKDSIINYADNVSINGGAANDVLINFASNVTIDGATSNDMAMNEGLHVFIDAGVGGDYINNAEDGIYSTLYGNSGEDTIQNDAAYSSINGGDENDSIENTGSYTTINGGSGNDIIKAYGIGETIQYSAGGGTDTIYGYNSGKAIAFVGDVQYTTLVSGSDILIGINNDTLRLVGAADYDLNIVGDAALVNGNYTQNTTVNGTSGDDEIYNYAGGVKINGGAGNDFIVNRVEKNLEINEGQGNVTIDGGAGNDKIFNINTHVSINGGDGNDSIQNNGETATIRGGAGNDSISGIGTQKVYQYASGDGNDVIVNFNSEDTVSITDRSVYSTMIANNDVVVSVVGSGSITLKNSASKKLNIKGGIRRLDGTDNADRFKLAVADGDYLINYFDANDTLQVDSGSISKYARNGNDYIVTLKSGSSSSKVTLKGAGGYGFTTSGANLIATSIVSLPSDYKSSSNTKNKQKINGTVGKDYIVNSGENVTVQANGGNDIIKGADEYGDLFLFGAGDGHDSIVNFGNNDTLQITGGSISSLSTVGSDLIVNVRGQSSVGTVTLKDAASKNVTVKGDYLTVIPDINTIRSSADGKKITGTTARDYIINTHDRVTIQAGKGNDTIESSNYGELFQFSYASDNDVIIDFGKNDSLQCTSGTITAVDKIGNDVVVTMTRDKSKGTVTLKDVAAYSFINSGSYLIVDVVNVIENDDEKQLIEGTDYRDEITNTGEHVTIQSSKGLDTITGSDLYGELYQLSSVDGGNIITNFGSNDTIQVIKGSIHSTVLSADGNDLIVKLGAASTAGTVTLQGVGSYVDLIKQSGKYLIFDDVELLYSRSNNKKVSGSSKKRSYIVNTANNVTLGGGGSQNDTLDGSDAMKEVYLFAGTSGKDLITNFGKEDTLYINSGSIVNQTREGDDYVVDVKSGDVIGTVTLGGAGIYPIITNGKKLTVDNVNIIVENDDDKKITGTSGRDYITGSGENITVQAGKGNDTIYGSNYGDMYLFSYASGDDVILNFDKDDTLKSTSGTISAVDVDGNDVIVSIKQKGQKAVGTVTLKNAADLKFFKQVNSTTLVIDDVNFIDNDEDGIKVTGTAKRDYITNDGENVTIQAGKSNDTIVGSDLYGETFLFSYAAGNNVVTNFGENDTLQNTSGTMTYKTVGSDVVVSIKKGSTTGTITLGGAGAYELVKDGNNLFANPINHIEASKDKQKVTGTTGNDYIVNPGFERVSIQAGKGNDTIDGSIFGETFLFSYASDDDLITNFDAKDTVRSTSGTLSYKLDGDDVIVSIKKGSTVGTVTLEGAAIYKADLKKTDSTLYVNSKNIKLNTEDNKKITGTTGVDYISNTGENVTIQAGAGNDVLTGSDEYGDRFLFSYASGDDTITNFSLGDTVQSTSGTVSYKQSGNDYIVSIKKSGQKSVGTITLRDAAIDYTLQKSGNSYAARPKSTSAQLPSDNYWFIDDSTVEETPLSAIVEKDHAVDLPSDFNDAFKQSTFELSTSARSRRMKSVK